MRKMAKVLGAAGFAVVNWDYTSTRQSILESAQSLYECYDLNARYYPRVHFVTHSLGGIVARCMVKDRPTPKLGRMVMIAPPNRGAYMASKLADWGIFRIVAGPVIRQLAGGPESLIASLPEPRCEFGVIAGGRGNARGYLPLLPGDDDGVVMVRETHLDGMRDFLLVPAIHTFIMNDERVKQAVAQFLRTGRFRAG